PPRAVSHVSVPLLSGHAAPAQMPKFVEHWQQHAGFEEVSLWLRPGHDLGPLREIGLATPPQSRRRRVEESGMAQIQLCKPCAPGEIIAKGTAPPFLVAS